MWNIRSFPKICKKVIFDLKLLVKERRGVFVETIEDIAHERLADEAASIGYIVAVKIALKHTHLTIVEHDSYAVITRLTASPRFIMRWFSHVFSKINAKPETYVRVGSGG